MVAMWLWQTGLCLKLLLLVLGYDLAPVPVIGIVGNTIVARPLAKLVAQPLTEMATHHFVLIDAEV
jgi:hypothetical protein